MDTRKQRPIVLTGLQPTSGVHLGNYLGALQNWKDIQEQADCLFFISDMHAITVFQDPVDLQRNTTDCIAIYMACGLDPKKSHIFIQSHVTGHAELAWVLSCFTPIGQLERMTQFKDKASRQLGEFIGAGLLYYPVLMAADILLYNANLVPVGEDQRQHLELTRDVAEKFNGIHGVLFHVPEPLIRGNCTRIMSLQNPTAKMSKSDSNSLATVFFTDDDDQIAKKIRSAVTDSGTEIRATDEKPGVQNLLHILSGASGKPIPELEMNYAGVGYGKFKNAVAEAVVECVRPIRARMEALKKDPRYLQNVVEDGRAEAQARASAMLAKVYDLVGFVRRSKL
ncbi:MAG: tryptophan--tRNA ligase [Puniceicoccales bacterium]|nr:tryptophan--tRNA ligase [Puniceicoccales bacterium]